MHATLPLWDQLNDVDQTCGVAYIRHSPLAGTNRDRTKTAVFALTSFRSSWPPESRSNAFGQKPPMSNAPFASVKRHLPVTDRGNSELIVLINYRGPKNLGRRLPTPMRCVHGWPLEIRPSPRVTVPNIFDLCETRDCVDPSKAFTPRIRL